MTTDGNLADIFINYTSNIRRFISRIVSSDDLEDIVQETYIKSYEADLKQKIKYPRSYMLKTAKNLALNHVAKWDNKYKDSLEDFVELPVNLNTAELEDEFESKERFLLFCKATDQLSGPVKKCFILKKVYGFSQKEIAQYLSISESTVEKHVAKGLLNSVKFMKQSQIEKNDNSDNRINTHHKKESV